ncbi:MAG: NIL domain-containing protein [Nitrospirae bacterium]|nr:NIL domain-containing protein [Nitrospirota bacterium]
MASVKIRLTFPEDKIKEPIIYNIGHEFKVVTNIRRADVREKKGWVDLEVTGESSEIEKAVESLKTKGVKVDPIEKNVIE